ncbi:porin [Pseudolysobacter antarcticus]|uniref:Porin n=1 Tax=Pseudolysobacter antarcticus TaxID=2511995 RepID=A0A411HM33_9GAMM|nr:porin [Pseudolysobacter antarcticus]QBB71427.1 porin [Pseudolysobacter antarcticus]
MSTFKQASSLRIHSRYAKKFRTTTLISALFCAANCVTAAHAAEDESLTWNGITLYGVFDIGVAYQTHGTPLSQDWFVGLEYLISKNSNKSITSVAPNGLSQSKIGLKGVEPISEGLSAVFNSEIGFDPQSGNLADALKSLTHNNGVALDRQTSAGDSARAGQVFNGQIYAGLSSRDFGTITFGRQNTLLLENILKYDAFSGSYAFSPIGLSGVCAGGGDTENTRLDNSVKYFYKNEMFHGGVMYQFGKTDSSPGEALQTDLGFEYAGFSLDGVYARKKDAIAAASLSAAQVTILPIDSLAATISDNTSYTLGASYILGPLKAFAGYNHIKYQNPSLPITEPFNGLGGYYLSVINNSAFPNPKVLQISWGGLKYAMTKDIDITGAIYHYDQNSYGKVHCSNTSAGTCSGTLEAYSVALDYRFAKRFDAYAGVMFSRVADGLASGFLNTSTADPMIGFRFKF